MMLEVETVVAVSLMMAVFSAVAAVGSSIVLGVGFERLRGGFEVIRKQTGFFSDAIHKLEGKMEEVDKTASSFGSTLSTLEEKVSGVGEQANAFTSALGSLEEKVEVVNAQTGYFSEALYKLENQVDLAGEHEEIVAQKLEEQASTDFISTGKAEALVSHAEGLLDQVSVLATQIQGDRMAVEASMDVGGVEKVEGHLTLSQNQNYSVLHDLEETVCYH